MPFPLRVPLAFDGKLLGQVLRIFSDSVTGFYRKQHRARGLPAGETGAVTGMFLMLGFQTVFSSFFLSMLGLRTRRVREV